MSRKIMGRGILILLLVLTGFWLFKYQSILYPYQNFPYAKTIGPYQVYSDQTLKPEIDTVLKDVS